MGVGNRYLIQHSAGSGKSNSISWLAHQLVGLEKEAKALFWYDYCRYRPPGAGQAASLILSNEASRSHPLLVLLQKGHNSFARFWSRGKKVIITTVQKFHLVLDQIGDHHRNSKFAIIIDEAHSSLWRSHCIKNEYGAGGIDCSLRRTRRGYWRYHQQEHYLPQDAFQRKLLCLHRYAKKIRLWKYSACPF